MLLIWMMLYMTLPLNDFVHPQPLTAETFEGSVGTWQRRFNDEVSPDNCATAFLQGLPSRRRVVNSVITRYARIFTPSAFRDGDLFLE